MDNELLNYLLRKASEEGKKGNTVIGWIPPTNATQDYRGSLLVEPARLKNATEA